MATEYYLRIKATAVSLKSNNTALTHRPAIQLDLVAGTDRIKLDIPESHPQNCPQLDASQIPITEFDKYEQAVAEAARWLEENPGRLLAYIQGSNWFKDQ